LSSFFLIYLYSTFLPYSFLYVFSHSSSCLSFCLCQSILSLLFACSYYLSFYFPPSSISIFLFISSQFISVFFVPFLLLDPIFFSFTGYWAYLGP
jgi:hypothetical protein